MMFFVIFTVYFLSGIKNCTNSVSIRIDPLVQTQQGLVRGQLSEDGIYSYFLGIPYAKVDPSNPFGAFLHQDSFNETVFDASDGSSKCPQYEENSDLDSSKEGKELNCLKLNIYVPQTASKNNPLPVLVWFHGGGFMVGFNSADGVSRLIYHDIVIVTPNYRLGPYGFICLDNPKAPGNQGLKDQYEAMHWVRRNIDAFGGDPFNVTLGGISAGSISSLYHLYADKEKLFNGVIAQSGVPQTDRTFSERNDDAFINIANQLGLNVSDTNQAIDQLSKTSHELVMNAVKDLDCKFWPCKEKSFSGVDNYVEYNPFTLSNKEKVRGIPILIGNTDLEVQDWFLDYFIDKNNDNNLFYYKIKDHFNLSTMMLLESSEIIKTLYVGDKDLNSNVTLEISEFISDFAFSHPIQRTITNLVEEKAVIYEYVFGYSKAEHTSEMKFLFDNSVNGKPANFNDVEQKISSQMLLLWSNFIKFGNPTPRGMKAFPFIWKPITKDKRPFLFIGEEIKLKNRYKKEKMSFWDFFYLIYGKYQYSVKDCY